MGVRTEEEWAELAKRIIRGEMVSKRRRAEPWRLLAESLIRFERYAASAGALLLA